MKYYRYIDDSNNPGIIFREDDNGKWFSRYPLEKQWYDETQSSPFREDIFEITEGEAFIEIL